MTERSPYRAVLRGLNSLPRRRYSTLRRRNIERAGRVLWELSEAGYGVYDRTKYRVVPRESE